MAASYIGTGAPIVSATCDSSQATQQFVLYSTGTNSNSFQIQVKGSNECVYSTGIAGLGLDLGPCPQTNWGFGGSVIAAPGGLCIDVYGANHNPGTEIDSGSCNGTSAQDIWPFGWGLQLEAYGDNECLDVSNGVPALENCTKDGYGNPAPGPSQTWYFTSDTTMKNGATGTCLYNVTGQSPPNNLRLGSCTKNSTNVFVDGQWLVSGRPLGVSWLEQNPFYNVCVDIYGGQIIPNQPVDLYTCGWSQGNLNHAQIWSFGRPLPRG
jgi:hypothetical protein